MEYRLDSGPWLSSSITGTWDSRPYFQIFFFELLSINIEVFLDYFVDLIDNWFIHWHNTCASSGFLNLKYSNDAIVSVLNFFLSFSQWVLNNYGQSGAGFIFTILHNCIRFTSAIKIYFISKFMYIFWEGILFYRAELIRHSSTTPSLEVFREWNRIGGSP